MAWSRERTLLYCLIAPLLLIAVFTAGSSLLRPVIWHFQGLSSSSLPAASSSSSLSLSSSASAQKAVSIDEIGSLISTDPVLSETKGDAQKPSSQTSPAQQQEKQTIKEEALVPVDPKKVQGVIEAGFSRERAEEALRHFGPEASIHQAVEYLTSGSSKESELSEFSAERECITSENTDYDGYAVRWGIEHLTNTAAECCEACKSHKPVPPSYFVCNVWVWCGKEICFAPAAHNFTFGQCWLKHQDDPTNPQINMQGKYTPQYHKKHPTAPEYVDWTAGVVVKKGTKVSNGTWSPRANW